MTRGPGHIAAFLLLFLGSVACGQTYRTSFEEGDKKPEGWTCDAKDCKWVSGTAHTGKRSVSVIGTKTNQSMWRSTNVKLEPGQYYRMTFYQRGDRTGEGGCSVTGAGFAYQDFQPKEKWEQREIIFQAPHTEYNYFLRLAQWHFPGVAYFDDVALDRVGIAYLKQDGIALGRDEKIVKGAYVFKTDFRSTYSNCFRVVEELRVTYHSGWLEFRDKSHLTFAFCVANHKQRSGRIKFLVARLQKGTGVVAVSKDKKTWDEIARLTNEKEKDQIELELPKGLFPAEQVFVRMSVEGATSFNLNTFEYRAELDGNPPDVVGHSRWFRGHMVVVDTGGIQLAFEQGRPDVVQFSQGGKTIGRLGCAVAQFEKQGVGYKKAGVGLARATAVKSVVLKEKTPQRCVVEVTAERTESAEAQRRFEMKVRIEALAGQEWVRCRLLSIKNTDSVAYEIRGYCHLLDPIGSKGVKSVNFPACAGWIVDKQVLGCLAIGDADFVLSFRRQEDALHGEMVRRTGHRLAPGETWQANEPEVVIFLCRGSDGRAVFELAQRIGAMLGQPAGEIASGAIKYSEEKEERTEPEKAQ